MNSVRVGGSILDLDPRTRLGQVIFISPGQLCLDQLRPRISAINKPMVAEDWDLSKSAKKSTLGLMPKMEKKTLSTPDEKRSFDKGQVELVTLGGVTFGRATLQPGWSWSTCVKPIVGTESCQAPHLQYHISGRLRVRMDDGSEDEFGPGEVSLLPPGHDAWVVGAEPVVVIDITGMATYAKPG